MTTPGDMTSGGLAARTFAFGFPLSLALALHGLFNLVDAVIVGQLGQGAIAAVTISGVIVMVPMLLFEGVCNLTVAYVARAHGARRTDHVHAIGWESLVVAAAATVLTAAVTPWCSHLIRSEFDFGDPATTKDAVLYLEIMMYGAGTMFLIQIVTSVLRGVGNAFWPVAILVGSNVLNIVLDIALVFGKWGFPALGVAGAAWATVIARGLGAAVGLLVIARGVAGLDFRAYGPARPFRWWKPLVALGVPSSVQLAVRVVALVVLLQIAKVASGADPKQVMDGVGIAIRLEMIPVFIMFGWGAAATTVVGQNLGAGAPGRASAGAWWAVAYAALTSTVIAVLLWAFRFRTFELVMPGIPNATLEFGLTYWRITLPAYAVLAVGAVLGRALNGAGSTRTGLVIDVLCYVVVLMPLAALVSGAGLFGAWRGDGAGPAGAWMSLVAVHVLAGIVYTVVFVRGRWKAKKIHVLSDAPLTKPS